MATVDYIIIGAGSAGCLLANRLSANKKHQVILLEAGGRDKNPNIHIPAAFSKLFKAKEDWNYSTVPQKYMNGRQMFQPRGKVLGGSSSTNAMIYIRGHRYDYDQWAELGNKGWSYEEVLPYFKSFEHNTRLKDEFHGQKGELNVTDQPWRHPFGKRLLDAAKAAGYDWNEDFNGAEQEGFGYYQVTQKEGRRHSGAAAFLSPVLHRSNLNVEINALVHKIIVENGEAKAVLFEQNGTVRTIHAQKEVILCAGAFGSPHLLMLSGIGHEAELRQHGIKVEHHLPGVGKNLQDHLIGGMAISTHDKTTLDGVERFPQVFKNLWQYFVNKGGPLTSNVAELGGFLKSDPAIPAPDLQFLFAAAYFVEHGFQNPKTGNGYSFGPTLIAPFSIGEVRLTSSNPQDYLEIDPNYFSDERDVQVMVKGCHIVQKILDQAPFDSVRGKTFMPNKEIQNDDEMAYFLRQYCETLYHPVGTCKMGSDDQAVVDEQLRVHGVRKLRVADASIMPIIIRGNTNAPTMMIAEKASSMILQQSSKSTQTIRQEA